MAAASSSLHIKSALGILRRDHIIVEKGSADEEGASFSPAQLEIIFSAIRALPFDAPSNRCAVAEIKALDRHFFIKKAASFEHAQAVSDLSRKELAPKMYFIARRISHLFYMVFERYDGDFFDLSLSRMLSTSERVAYAARFLHVLAAFHAEGKVHGDIKPENVVFSRKDNRVRLIDFPPSKREMEFTLDYLAPWKARALLRGKALSTIEERQADVYASALTVYGLLTGRRLLPKQDPHSMPPKKFLASLMMERGNFDALKKEVNAGLGANTSLPRHIQGLVSKALCTVLLEMPPYRATALGFFQRMHVAHVLLKIHSDTEAAGASSVRGSASASSSSDSDEASAI